MIWLNPWAWLGIVGIALPILIHLLGRGHAQVRRFPTLRFLDASRLLPTKRSRIQDPLLLAVRVAIVALAALALAQPLLLTAGRKRSLDRGLARAVIIDTSASMYRRATSGTLIDSARASARQLAAEAQTSVVVESNDPATAIPSAVAWLARQERRGELVVVSDFQRGQIGRADLGFVPPSVGIALRQLTTSDTAAPRLRVLADGRVTEARVRVVPTGTDVEWSASTVGDSTRIPVELLAGPTDASTLAALQAAVATIAVPLPIDTSRSVAVLFARYPSREAVVGSLQPPRVPWTLELLAKVRRSALPLTAAGVATVGSKRQFVLVTRADPTSVEAAELVNLARQAASSAPLASEIEPSSLSPAELRRWERSPPQESSSSQHRPLDDAGPSDGRWLWTIVLVALFIEWRLRQLKVASEAIREGQARAA
jgi:hypothetical protein